MLNALRLRLQQFIASTSNVSSKRNASPRLNVNAIEDEHLREYLRAPLIDTACDYRKLEFLALDLEMTSLDSLLGEIVSIGYVPIVKGCVDISQGVHSLVRSQSSVGQSATIHGICDRELDGAVTMAEVFPPLFQALRGRVLLLHHARLDLAFLNRYCQQIYSGLSFNAMTVDTLALEKRRLHRQQEVLGKAQLRLNSCRQRYGLPNYRAHNAYTDALATAELFLAQAAAMAGREKLSLRQLL